MRLYSSHTRNSPNSWSYNSIEKVKARSAAKVGAPPCKYPDWQVLEARRLIENEGLSVTEVATKLKLPKNYVKQLKQYMIRDHLTPDPTRMEPYTP